MGELAFLAAATVLNCINPTTQSDISQCAYAEYLAADAELNRQWSVTSQAMKRLDQSRDTRHDKRPSYFAALLTSQRAWISYREAQCVIQGYQMRGGSGEGMAVSMCLEALTKLRINQLRNLEESF
jgi:uncharacterized protein YecT (DUF1311 family)